MTEQTKKYAKNLRKNMQIPEIKLWYFLRNKKFLGYKFRRQVPFGKYILDFVCFESKLVIELDGREHLKDEHIKYDNERTKFLNSEGFCVLRFYNSDVMNNIELVLEEIRIGISGSPSSVLRTASPIKGEAKVKSDSPSTTQQTDSPTKGEARVTIDISERLDENMINKSSLRKWAKSERKKLDMEYLSQKLIEKLRSTKEYQQAKNVMIFYPKDDEVNLLELLSDDKNFYLPKISGNNLIYCSYKNGDELCESCFKTKEPTSSPCNVPPDLIIVPALAVDKQNYRLGYGGGFYDRFLSNNNATKIVCIPKSLIVETIYPESTDIQMDKIITD